MPERIHMTNTVETWCPQFIAVAAVKLQMGKGDVMTAALSYYKHYLLDAGIITEKDMMVPVLNRPTKGES